MCEIVDILRVTMKWFEMLGPLLVVESWNSFVSGPGFWCWTLWALPLCQGHSAFCPSSSRPEEAMVSVSEQVSQKIHERLKDMGLTALSSEKKASLRGQLQNIAKKENRVRNIIGKSPPVVVGLGRGGKGRGSKNVEGNKVDWSLEVSCEDLQKWNDCWESPLALVSLYIMCRIEINWNKFVQTNWTNSFSLKSEHMVLRSARMCNLQVLVLSDSWSFSNYNPRPVMGNPFSSPCFKLPWWSLLPSKELMLI